MTSLISTQLKKSLIFIHRWMGVLFCLLFLMWFASGMVLMYWDYPLVGDADRLERAPALDMSKIRISPQQAYSQLQSILPPAQVRLGTFDGRPAYRFGSGGEETIVYADTGLQQMEFPPEMTLRIASAWTGQPPGDAKVEPNETEDQWTVSGEFRELRPMMKYTWPDGEEVYVSTVTGAVAQYTTRASRMGAYFGAIPHWLYFTQLRKRAASWSRLVIWASGLAGIAAIFGITVGIWTFSPSKRYQYAGAPARIPYTGQKRWHMILGLIFGLLACTWAFSGMLSMDPFPWQRDSDDMGSQIADALRGGPLDGPLDIDAFAPVSPREVLAALGSDLRVKELELTTFAGDPAYLAIATPNQTRVIPVSGGLTGFARLEPAAEFDHDRIIEVVRKAAQPVPVAETKILTRYDAYYLDRHNQLPLPVLFVRLANAANSTYYIDPKTARIVEGYNSRSRWNRWLYHGLHSINLPWLYEHRPAWDIVVLTLMIGGASLCVTSIILAWRVVRRKLELLL